MTLSDRLGTTRNVRVPPDRQTLRRVAQVTGGQYFGAADQKKLNDVYRRLGSRIGFRQEKREVTAAFAARRPRPDAGRGPPVDDVVRAPALTVSRPID